MPSDHASLIEVQVEDQLCGQRWVCCLVLPDSGRNEVAVQLARCRVARFARIPRAAKVARIPRPAKVGARSKGKAAPAGHHQSSARENARPRLRRVQVTGLRQRRALVPAPRRAARVAAVRVAALRRLRAPVRAHAPGDLELLRARARRRPDLGAAPRRPHPRRGLRQRPPRRRAPEAVAGDGALRRRRVIEDREARAGQARRGGPPRLRRGRRRGPRRRARVLAKLRRRRRVGRLLLLRRGS